MKAALSARDLLRKHMYLSRYPQYYSILCNVLSGPDTSHRLPLIKMIMQQRGSPRVVWRPWWLAKEARAAQRARSAERGELGGGG